MAAHIDGPWTACATRTNCADTEGFAFVVYPEATSEPLAYVLARTDAAAIAKRMTVAPEVLAILQEIVTEVDGPGKPYSGDSYLPPHMVQAARAVIAKVVAHG